MTHRYTRRSIDHCIPSAHVHQGIKILVIVDTSPNVYRFGHYEAIRLYINGSYCTSFRRKGDKITKYFRYNMHRSVVRLVMYSTLKSHEYTISWALVHLNVVLMTRYCWYVFIQVMSGLHWCTGLRQWINILIWYAHGSSISNTSSNTHTHTHTASAQSLIMVRSSPDTMSTHLIAGDSRLLIWFFVMMSNAMSGVNSPTRTPWMLRMV